MGDKIDKFKELKKALDKELKKHNLVVRSAGTKTEDLKQPIDPYTGFWENPSTVTSKPPRWLLHIIEEDGQLIVNYPEEEIVDEEDDSIVESRIRNGAATIGYVNNREGNCSAMIFRILMLYKQDNESYIETDWEWLITIIQKQPLPAGTSGENISNFDVRAGTFKYSGEIYQIDKLVLSCLPSNEDMYGDLDFGYSEATEALKKFLANSREV